MWDQIGSFYRFPTEACWEDAEKRIWGDRLVQEVELQALECSFSKKNTLNQASLGDIS